MKFYSSLKIKNSKLRKNPSVTRLKPPVHLRSYIASGKWGIKHTYLIPELEQREALYIGQHATGGNIYEGNMN